MMNLKYENMEKRLFNIIKEISLRNVEKPYNIVNVIALIK